MPTFVARGQVRISKLSAGKTSTAEGIIPEKTNGRMTRPSCTRTIATKRVQERHTQLFILYLQLINNPASHVLDQQVPHNVRLSAIFIAANDYEDGTR
jgi:hypothetical protein